MQDLLWGIASVAVSGFGIVGGVYQLYKYNLLANSPEGQAEKRESDLLNQLIRSTNSQGVIDLPLLERVTGLSVDATTEKVRELITRGDLEGKITAHTYLPSGDVQEMLAIVVTEFKKLRAENLPR